MLNSSSSWVKDKWKSPSNRSVTGCQSAIDSCKDWIGKTAGGTWNFDGKADAKCPVSPVADPSVVATTVGECDSKIGTECDRVAALESARLLKHEQLHFSIACVLVKKANAAIAGGKDAATVKRKLDKVDKDVTDRYDSETSHGCKAGKQSSWEAEVAKDLPKESVA